jgi:hypothetical protein
VPVHACCICALQDMTRLSYLHEPGVLWNIKNRYIYDDIYTYTGSILIAVNPFANLAHLYGPHMMDQYRGVDLGDLSPHVYAIADAAYRQMRKEFKGQSILVRTAPRRSLKQQQGLQDVQSLQYACQHMRSRAPWRGSSSAHCSAPTHSSCSCALVCPATGIAAVGYKQVLPGCIRFLPAQANCDAWPTVPNVSRVQRMCCAVPRCSAIVPLYR